MAEEDSVKPDENPHHEVHWYSLFTFITRNQIPLLCGGLLLSIAAGAIQPVSGLFAGKIFAAISEDGNEGHYHRLGETVRTNCIYFCCLACISWALQFSATAIWMIFGELQTQCLRKQVFNALLRKSITWYDTRPGGVQSTLVRLQTQIHDVREGLAYPLPAVIEDISLCLVSLTLAMVTSWRLTLVTLSVTPLIILASAIISARLNHAIEEFQKNLQQAAQCASESIRFIDVVKCFNAQTYSYQRYINAVILTLAPWARASRLISLMTACGQLAFYAIFIIAFWYGNHLVNTKQIAVSDVMTAFWASFSAMGSVSSLMPSVMAMKTGQVSAAFLLDLVAENEDSSAKSYALSGGRYMPQECRGLIKFDNVTFCYPGRPDVPILKGVSFRASPRKLTFIVGHSGSGKSTFGSLLAGFYGPSSGNISIDGISLNYLSLAWLRENVTFIQQKSVLFKDTIEKNIAIGSLGPDAASPADILEAISFASLTDVINGLPMGLDTLIGAAGSMLSGGQMQRIALARARLRDPTILILDEPTSALEHGTRVSIMEEIRKWRKDKTTIIITHDLSQINDDDVLYVLEDGKLNRRGIHQGLGTYLQVATRDIAVMSPSLSMRRRSLRMNARDSIDDLGSPYWHPGRSSRTFAPFPEIRSPEMIDSMSHMRRRRMSFNFPLNPVVVSSPLQTSINGLFRSTRMSFSPRLGTTQERSEFPLMENTIYRSEGLGLGLNPIAADPVCETPELGKYWDTNRSSLKVEEVADNLEPTEPDGKYMSIAAIMKTIPAALETRHNVLLTSALACTVIHAAATPMFSYLFGKLLDTFSPTVDQGTSNARLWSLCIIAIAVLDAVAHFIQMYIFEYTSVLWVNKYRKDAMYTMLRQSKEWFEEEENNMASLSMILDQYGEETKKILSTCTSGICAGLFITVIGVSWSFAICWKLALVGLSCAPLLFVLTWLDMKVTGIWNVKYNEMSEEVADVYTEVFTDIQTVRGLTLESYFQQRLHQYTSKAASIGFKRSCWTGVMSGWGQSSILLIYALIFWYGNTLISSGYASTQDVISCIMMLTFTVVHASSLFETVPQLSLSQQSASRLLRLALLPLRRSREDGGSSEVSNLTPIVFSDVRFAYKSREDVFVLDQVSFEIVPNSCTAIVGHSGSGKSTVAALLVKLYEMNTDAIQYGRITFNGKDIYDLQATALRSMISIVPQTPMIFPMSISENIAFGQERYSWQNNMERIKEAARAAGIHDFITSLPQGYETVIGGTGLGLSGGQAQRLAIARAIFRRPKLLILDEATANLDSESAMQVKETIRNLLEKETQSTRRLTVIVITHAQDMVRLSNRVVVLDKGRVVESGKTRDLLRRPGGKLKELFNF